MENMCERFKAVRNHFGLSQPDMSDRLGLSKNVWQTYELGKSTPGTPVFQQLIAMGISANWVIHGCGGMLIGGCIRESDGYSFLPLYGAQPQMGNGAVVSDEIIDWIAFKTEWLRVVINGPVTSLAIVVGDGDSMMPTISPGDVLIVDTSKDYFNGDGIYVLNLFGNSLVKRVQAKCDGSVEILSDNPAYKVQVIRGDDLSSLSIVGRVVWHGKHV